MFNLFLPRKTRAVLNESELIQSSLKRHRTYSQDILSAKELETVKALEDRYPPLLKARDVEGLEQLNEEIITLGARLFPPSPWEAWRENVEVFVVAAIMALTIRTFFLQPFKIPTGSMEPTLFGIEPKISSEMPPNFAVQLWDFFIHGKSYSRVVTRNGGTIVRMEPGTFTIWLEYTDLTLADKTTGREETDRVWIRPYDVQQKLHLYPGMDFKPGDVLANYVTQTGDQVLVDKVTYNFRPPRRGEVFIFKTAGIAGLDHERGPDQEGSEDFIKRCVALAGDLVEIKEPFLYIQKPGETTRSLASGASIFAKEFERKDGYPGYTLINPGESTGTTENGAQIYYVPTDCYWAMGDNSPNSKDSRFWGGVPRQNLVGRGYFVFWPFTERWGWIK